MSTRVLQTAWEPSGLGPARSFLIALLLEGALLAGLGLLLLMPGSRMSKNTAAQRPMQARLVTLPAKKAVPVVHRPPPPRIEIQKPKPVPRPPLHLHVKTPVPRVDAIRVPPPKPVRHQPKPKVQPTPRPTPAKHVPIPEKAVVPHPPAQAAMSSREKATILQAYAAALHVLLQDHVVVGRMVRQLKLSGTVVVAFKLKPGGGSAFDIHVRGGSANPLLVKDALATVKALSFPPFSKGMPGHALTFVVPIEIRTES